MKTFLCISLLTLLAAAATAADAAPATPKPEAQPKVEVAGKATVTIEVNGKKVTREIDLGKPATVANGNTFGSTWVIDGVSNPLPANAGAPVVVRTWLGVITEEPSAEARTQLPIPNGTGLLIGDVFADSPAAKAGLEKNDILVRLDDQILVNPEQLRTLTSGKKDGDTVRVTYLRKGQSMTVEAKLASHTEEEPGGRINELISTRLNNAYYTIFNEKGIATTKPLPPQGGITGTLNLNTDLEISGNLEAAEKSRAPAETRTWLGVAADQPTEDVRAQLPLANGTGLLVRSVVADSPAAKAGLEKNDVLVKLDDQILTNPDQLRKLIGTRKEGDSFHVIYLRKGRESSVEVKLEARTGADVHLSSTSDATPEALARRFYIDVTGQPPTPEQIRVFVKEAAAQGQPGGASAYAAWVLDRLQKDPAKAGKEKVIVLQDLVGKEVDRAEVNKQWRLFLGNEGQVGVEEATKQLEKALRDAGVKEQGIAELKKALADTAAQLRRAAVDLGAEDADLQRQVQKAAEEIRRSVEQAWRAQAEAALKGKDPLPKAAPPAEKQP